MLSLHAVVGRADVVGAVRIAVVGEGEGEGQQQGPVRGKKAAAVVATAATRHRITHGRTKTRRDRGITIGNEDTTERWARQEQEEGPVASQMFDYYRTRLDKWMQIYSNQKILPLNSGSNVSSMTWFTIAKSRWAAL
jgi:hypothetical protein